MLQLCFKRKSGQTLLSALLTADTYAVEELLMEHNICKNKK